MWSSTKSSKLSHHDDRERWWAHYKLYHTISCPGARSCICNNQIWCTYGSRTTWRSRHRRRKCSTGSSLRQQFRDCDLIKSRFVENVCALSCLTWTKALRRLCWLYLALVHNCWTRPAFQIPQCWFQPGFLDNSFSQYLVTYLTLHFTFPF